MSPLELRLEGLPLPPSDNNLFPTVMVSGRPRRVRSAEYTAWLATMEGYHLKHNAALRAFAKGAKNHCLAITITLDLPWSVVFTASPRAKDHLHEFDAQNRIKAICDWLAAALDIDDRWFFRVSVEKRPRDKVNPSACSMLDLYVRPYTQQPASGGATYD